jgi:hypothetical protein
VGSTRLVFAPQRLPVFTVRPNILVVAAVLVAVDLVESRQMHLLPLGRSGQN